MHVHHATGLRMPQVNTRVNVESDLAQLAATPHHLALEIAHDEVARGDLLKQQAARVDQEKLVLAGEHQTVVIADLLVHAEPRVDAKRRRQIAAHLPF